MIDYRHRTFLQLCRIKNYTKTAAELNITQPAVSQHIKHLEKYYGVKLFNYSGKKLIITEAGQKLFKYAERMAADSSEIKKALSENDRIKQVKFGATLSIGEFVMPDILLEIFENYPRLRFDMLVQNTQVLIDRLKKGEINFAVLEGFFDKSKFGHQIFSREEFIGVCSPESELCDRKVRLEDLLNSRLILRENGSGTRDILEQILYKNNFSKNSFKSTVEIGNMNAIKKLVAGGRGISFLYKAAAENELKKGVLAQIDIIDFDVWREFNFVYQKDSIFEDDYQQYFNLFLQSCSTHRKQ